MGIKFLNLPKIAPTEKPKNLLCDTEVTSEFTATSGGLQAKRNDLLPNLKIEYVRVSDIKKSDHRVRNVSKNKTRKLKSTIAKFGVRKPVLLTAEFELIDGHALIEAAVQLGIKTIPCIIASDLTEVEIRALRLALNKTQELGEWDDNALRAEFLYLLEFENDLSYTGFEVGEIDQIIVLNDTSADGVAGHPADQPGELPAIDADAVTRPGDLWRLNGHRILCGNARHPEGLANLGSGENVSAIFTDPPYNVAVNGHVCIGSGKFEEFAEASGEMSKKEFGIFLNQTIGAMATTLKKGGVLFICMDWRHLADLTSVIDDLGLELLNICVWAKDKPGMGSFYRSQHEFVLVVRKAGAGHMNNIQLGKFGRNRSNVWRYAGATGGKTSGIDDFKLHPTVKPINLVRDAILDVTAIGDIILDPFLGSGTTVLAAEVAHRICFGVEISPIYVDVAIGRWEALTGLDAVHDKTGLTFAEMKAERSKGTDPLYDELGGTSASLSMESKEDF
ncbi:DNA modification methylase [Falsihalocynthiibacter sp. S25ZX9]|uniref:DNA modification methylase n=1 Tax=Falsihalocynthiibacter sp. S25ZX9 TaxID=3240870 RepID=UPI0035108AD3